MMDIITDSQSELVVRSPDGLEKSVALYSEEGVELLTALRLKQMAEFKTMYEPISLVCDDPSAKRYCRDA